MTTQHDIDEQFKKDYQKFWDQNFDAFTPEGLIEKFKVAIMKIPPGVHQYNLGVLERIFKKKEYDLNFLEVGMIVNQIFMIPFECLYITIEEGLEYTKQLEKLRIDFNEQVDKRQSELEKKRKRLYQLAGLTNSITMPSIKN